MVREMAMPEASAVTTWEVPCLRVSDQMTKAEAQGVRCLRFERLQTCRIVCRNVQSMEIRDLTPHPLSSRSVEHCLLILIKAWHE